MSLNNFESFCCFSFCSDVNCYQHLRKEPNPITSQVNKRNPMPLKGKQCILNKSLIFLMIFLLFKLPPYLSVPTRECTNCLAWLRRLSLAAKSFIFTSLLLLLASYFLCCPCYRISLPCDINILWFLFLTNVPCLLGKR